jgi:hypothetical protein
MYQYRIVRLVRIANYDTLTAVLDLGFDISTEVTFKVARVGVLELDLDLESDVDPAVERRKDIIAWFKTAPKPWTVQMYREGGAYKADILDMNGNLLNDALLKPPARPVPANDDTQVIHGLPIASTDPGNFG